RRHSKWLGCSVTACPYRTRLTYSYRFGGRSRRDFFRLFVVKGSAGHFYRTKTIENRSKCLRKSEKQQAALWQAIIKPADQLAAGFKLKVDRHILAEDHIYTACAVRKCLQQVERIESYKRAKLVANCIGVALRPEVAL